MKQMIRVHIKHEQMIGWWTNMKKHQPANIVLDHVQESANMTPG